MEIGIVTIPFSSIGYFFASSVLLVSAFLLHQKHKSNPMKSTEYLLKAMLWLAPGHFLWGLPSIFIPNEPLLLGYLTIPANIFLMMFHAYFGRFALALVNKNAIGDTFFKGMLLWTVFITLPINYLYLPMPFIDSNYMEVWAYSWQLFFALSVWSPITVGMVVFVLLKNFKSAKDKTVTGLLLISFILGGISSNFVVLARTPILLYLCGYIGMFMGAYWVLLLPFSFKQKES